MENVIAVILGAFVVLWVVVSEIILNARGKELWRDLNKKRELRLWLMSTMKMKKYLNKVEKNNEL